MSLVRWFRFGLGIFLLLSVLLGTVGCTSIAATPSWQKASSVVPSRTLERIIQLNTELDPSQAVEDVLAWTVKGTAGNLVILDFNNSGVCGAAGCLYTGYLMGKHKQLSQVFSSYLNPQLPADKPLFQVVERSDAILPCLQVMQVDGVQFRQMVYCFNGQHYQLASSRLLGETSN